MADVVLKNQAGEETTYTDVDTVLLNTADGGTTSYISEYLIQNQVQADWNQTDDTQPDYIKNKPATFESEPELPEVTTDDTGKVLGIADDGTIVWVNPGTELPEVSADDNGKILGVVEGVWAKTEAPSSVPDVTTDDDGKVLAVIGGVWSVSEMEEYTHPETHPASMITGLANVATTGNYADIAEKPFGNLVVSPETKVTFSTFEGSLDFNFGNFNLLEALVEGETYVVTWDKVEYTCIATDASTFNENIINCLYLGNATKCFGGGLGEDTGEPFFIAAATKDTDSYLSAAAHTDDMQTAHVISIVPKNNIRKIDSDYLPDGIATEAYVQQKISQIQTESSGNSLVEVLPVTMVPSGNLEEDTWATLSASPSPCALVEGETYTVVIDGVNYVCTAEVVSSYNKNVELYNNKDNAPEILSFLVDYNPETDALFAFCYTIVDGNAKFQTDAFTIQIYQGAQESSLTEVEILGKTLVEITDEVCMISPASCVLVEGEAYNVFWDGVTYVCTASIFSENGLDYVVVGNKTTFAEAGSEPFTIYYVEAEDALVVMSADTETGEQVAATGTHILRIFQTYDKTKLPEVSGADEGKVLKVVDGVWQAAYESTVEITELFENQSIPFIYDESAGFAVSGYADFETGKTYTVYFDGTQYSCTAHDEYSLGNLSLTESNAEDTGEPFFIGKDQIYMCMIAPTATPSTVVKIYDGDILLFETEQWVDIENGVLLAVRNMFTVNYMDTEQIYNVVFDGKLYQLKVNPNAMTLGNAYMYDPNLPDTGEPFVIASTPVSETEAVMYVALATGTKTNHTIRVYTTEEMDVKATELPEVSDLNNGQVLGVVDGSWAVTDAPSAGGELPEVTTDDNGKFLRVVNGAWTAYGGITEYTETTDVTFIQDEIDGVTYNAAVFDFELTDGETYTVSFDGVEYECTAVSRMLGNFALSGYSGAEDTGEPFFLMHQAIYVLMTAPTATKHTVVEISHGGAQIFRTDKWFEAEGMFGTAPVMCRVDISDMTTTYNVEYDWTVYPCTLKTIKVEDAIYYYLGNTSLTGIGAEDTGEPFYIDFTVISDTEAVAMQTLASGDGTTHTIRIYTEDETDKLPEFDLAAMGLPALLMDGTTVGVYCDTTELIEALENSPVKLKFTVNMDSEIPFSGIFGAMKMLGGYQCNVVGTYAGAVMLLNIGISPGGIEATILTLSTGA